MRVRSTRRRHGARVLAGVTGFLTLALVAGCGSSGQQGQGTQNGQGGTGKTLTVVASTNVWGSIVSAIAGPGVTVDSIIKDPTADPHSYESTPADAAAISHADLVVWNGGGYDDFAQKAIDAAPEVKGKAIEAFALKPEKADDNEHVWFDPPVVKGVVTQVADRLSAVEPTQAAALHQRAQTFTAKVDDEAAKLAKIGQAKPGSTVLSTEPIAHYLLATAGVADTTPTPFVEAIENESDPAPAALKQVDDALSGHQVRALVFNPQTETPVTQGIRATAQGAGLPVVDVTETLPNGQDYLRWLDGNRTALAAALGAPQA